MSARPTAPRAASTTTPKAPSPPVEQHPTTLLHPSTALTGSHPISLGAGTIIQLRSRLNSTYIPITIGDGALISERVSVGYLSAPHKLSRANTEPITIGEGVIIESGAVVEASSIGAFSIIEVGAKVRKGAVIGRGAKVGICVEIGEGEEVRDGECVWGNGPGERRVDRKMLESGDGTDGFGMKARRDMVKGLGEGYRRLWTGK